MAEFKGAFKDFEQFIGPTTNKVVTKLGKQLKKKQKSCQNHSLNDNTLNNENCRIWKKLDAAHLSHLQRDRKSIIKKILEEKYKLSEDLYLVDLEQFLADLENEHKPLKDSLIMLCRKHHSSYDTFNKAQSEEYNDVEILENDINEGIKIVAIDNFLHIKDSIIDFCKQSRNQEINKIDKENCTYSKNDGLTWKFDVINAKTKQGLNFIFFNKEEKTFDIGKLDVKTIKYISDDLPTKYQNKKSRKQEKSFKVNFKNNTYLIDKLDVEIEIIFSSKFMN